MYVFTSPESAKPDFGPQLRVHVNELADNQNWQQAHTVIHASYLSDLYV